ncbi:MAG: flippase-like domain-containing protein [Proteobacteria bacterium]|nr:flippase-like domain-containing protein [Pseudomonadota bacterium]
MRVAEVAGDRRWRKHLAAIVAAVFLLVVAVLLVRYARTLDWAEVSAALAGYGAAQVAAAGVGVALSYLLYGSYDLAARAYSGHCLSRRRVVLIAFISYAFNLNLGALVGAAGFRYRLYSRSGLDAATIGRIFGFSVVANWTGYALLGGALFALGLVALPPGWELGTAGLRVVGIAMLIAVTAYMVGCALWPRREWTVRGHSIQLPSFRLALLQVLLSAANWLVIAAILDALLPAGIPYPTVLGVLLLGAVAAAATHVPAGLGVLEATFLGLLGASIGQAEVLAALLAYRALYYLGPLLLAIAMYLGFEARARGRSPAER